MAKILALDTSSELCSVSLLDGDKVFDESQRLQNQHSQYLLKFVESVLSKGRVKLSDLDAIAVGNGPGSFTGLRLAVGVAQGLAYGANLPLIPISSLEAIAMQVAKPYLLVAVDARMGEVYWQCFERSQDLQSVTQVQLNKPGHIELDININWHGAGSGFDKYADQLTQLLPKPIEFTENLLPQASIIAKRAQSLIKSPGWANYQQNLVLPTYVRNKVTH